MNKPIEGMEIHLQIYIPSNEMITIFMKQLAIQYEMEIPYYGKLFG